MRFCPSLGAPENDRSKLTAPNIPSRRRQAKQNASIGAAQPAIQGMNVNEGIPGVGNLGMTGTLQSMLSAGEGNPTGFWNGEQVGFDADGVILNTGAAAGQVNGSVPGVSNPGMADAFQPILSDGQGNPASSFNEQDVGIDLGLGSHAAGTARANGGVPGVINPGMAGAPQPILGGDQEHLASSVNGQINSNAAGEGQANGGVPGVDNPGMAGALQPILSSLHGNPASSITDQKVDDGMGPKDTNVIGIVPVPVNPGMTGKLEAENKFWARLEKLKKKYPLPDTVPIVRIMIDRQPADEKKEHENSMRHCFALLRLDRSVKFQPNFTPDLLESLDFFMHRVTTDYKNLEKSGMLHVPIVSSPQDNQEPRESQPVMRGRSGSSAMHAAVNAAKMKPIVDQENDLSLEGSKTQLPKQVAAVPVSTSNVDKHGLVNAPELPVNHGAAPSNGKDLSRNEQELTESETAEPQAARDIPGGTLKPSKAERSGKDENVFMADETLGTPKKASGEVIVCAHEQMMDAREANQESTAAEDVPDASGKGTTAGRNAEPVLSSAPAESPEATAAGLIYESDAEPGTTAGPIAPAPEAIDSGVPNAKKRTRVEASQDHLVDHALNTARLAAKRADLLERHKEARIQDTLDAMRNESSFLDDLDWTDDETGSRADTAMDEDDDSRMKDVRRTDLELFNGALDVFERENGAELAKALENEADTADGDARDTAAGDETGADVGDASTETGLPPAKRLKK